MKRVLISASIFVFVALAALAAGNQQRIERVLLVRSLFSGAEQYDNFHRITDFTHVTTMSAAAEPHLFPQGDPIILPADFPFRGTTTTTSRFLADTDTSALLVLKDGHLVYENYWLTGGREVHWTSWSMAKSYISALIGIAIADGHIESVEKTVTDYVPALKGSGYDGVRLKDVLQMSSGTRWTEDYADPESDIMRWARLFALGGSTDQFLASLTRERTPGSYNRYSSADTQVLGLVLVKATGRSLTDYMQEKLWHPLGAQDHADWINDTQGREIAAWGLNVTARDYAKLGELYRLSGHWRGKQLVPAGWIKQSVTPDAPYLMPGANPNSNHVLGYGYQWWIPDGDRGDFTAMGVYNQFIYVDPKSGVVIVKLSANRHYGTSHEEAAYREVESIEFFRRIADGFMQKPADDAITLRRSFDENARHAAIDQPQKKAAPERAAFP